MTDVLRQLEKSLAAQNPGFAAALRDVRPDGGPNEPIITAILEAIAPTLNSLLQRLTLSEQRIAELEDKALVHEAKIANLAER
jgi:hypothetical protein